MAQSLIAVDPDALDALRGELQRLHDRLDRVEMTPMPKWVTVDEFAKMIGKHRRTVTRRIEAGLIETKTVGGERLVRVNLGD